MKYLSALVSINCAILLAVIAIALSFEMRKAADEISPDVSARFLETGGSYERQPPARAAEPRRGTPAPARNLVTVKTNDTEAAALRRWVTANSGSATAPGPALRYANPILIQYDIAFALALGLFLMIATVRMASAHVFDWFALPPRLIWAFAVLPAVYIVADLAEDLMLWRFLTDRATISSLLVGITQKLTMVKIYSLIGAMAVAALVALIGMAHALVNARKS